jgi:hypothetical protein
VASLLGEASERGVLESHRVHELTCPAQSSTEKVGAHVHIPIVGIGVGLGVGRAVGWGDGTADGNAEGAGDG